jgi:Ca2+-binding EF-hand superfamily protein
MRAWAFLVAALAAMLCGAPAQACIQTPEKKAKNFVALDRDADGFLSRDEFFTGVSPHKHLTQDEEQALFTSVDTDGDGSLSLEEFSALSLTRGGC